MRDLKQAMCCITALVLAACDGDSDPARTTPDTATLLGKDVISSELPEFAAAVTADHDEIYFNRHQPDGSEMRIYHARWEEGDWAVAEPVSFSTGEWNDADPFVTSDGQRLFFSSTRPLPGGSSIPDGYNFWVSAREAGGWGEPTPLGTEVNPQGRINIFNSLTADGVMVFSSFLPDRSVIIYEAQPDGEGFAPAEKMLVPHPADWALSNPAIAPDGSFIILAYREAGGPPNLAITYRKESGSWGFPVPLSSAVNTDEYAEYAPHISPDMKALYFTSDRPGMVTDTPQGTRPPGDIYVTSLEVALDS